MTELEKQILDMLNKELPMFTAYLNIGISKKIASLIKNPKIKFPDYTTIFTAIRILGEDSTAPDKDTPNWMQDDIQRGIDWAINWIKENNK